MRAEQGHGFAGTTTRAWWKSAPAPELAVVSPGRAYVEVLLVFAAFFGAGVANALLLLAGRIDTAGGADSWAVFGPAAFGDLATAGLAVALVVLLGRVRGCSIGDLGMRLRRDGAGRLRWWAEVRVAAWAILALLVGAAVTSAFKTGSIDPGSAALANLVYRSAHSIEAGFMEECVVLAFLVTTLRQARRPVWEIVAVALILRVSYHLYYGPGAAGILIWALVFVWLFLRTRSLIPLIVVHCCWDLAATFSAHWRPVGALWVLAMFGLLIVAPISWLVERSQPGTATGLPPAGWHPDPWVGSGWRWWDGARWTAAVSNRGGPVAGSASGPFSAPVAGPGNAGTSP